MRGEERIQITRQKWFDRVNGEKMYKKIALSKQLTSGDNAFLA
jgi:hypothetical protein